MQRSVHNKPIQCKEKQSTRDRFALSTGIISDTQDQILVHNFQKKYLGQELQRNDYYNGNDPINNYLKLDFPLGESL